VPTQPSRKVAVVEVGGRRTNEAVVGRRHVSAVSMAGTSFMVGLLSVLVWIDLALVRCYAMFCCVVAHVPSRFFCVGHL